MILDPATCAVSKGHSRRLAMTITEAAVAAGIGRDGIYQAIRDGRLDARKWGRRTIITQTALESFLNALPALQLSASREG